MSSTDRVDILRELNKDLLNQLKQQREKLERLSGCRRQSRKREREDEAGERRDPEETRTLTWGGQGSSRAGLTKPTVRFSGNETVLFFKRGQIPERHLQVLAK